jgi:PAS domain S-box-containing protein
MAKSSVALRKVDAAPIPRIGTMALPGSSALRLRLALFALACMGFALLIASVYFLASARKDQREIEARAQLAASTSAQLVDREIAAASALLTGLSVSPSLASGDLAAFHREAGAAAAAADSAIVLMDSNYRGLESNLVNTNRPFGSSPLAAPPETEKALRGLVKEVVAARQPRVTDSIFTPFARMQSVAVAIPVLRRDEVVYVLAAVLLHLGDAALNEQDALPPGWFAGVVDRNGKYISSHLGLDRAASRPVIDPAILNAAGSDRGSLDAFTTDGRPVRVSYTRSRATGLTAVTAFSSSALDEPISRATLLLGAGAATTLVFAVAFAIVAAPNLSRPLQRRIAETEERFSVIADTVPSILFIGHGDGHCDYVGERFYAYTGLPPGAAAGLGWAAAVHPADRERIRRIITAPDKGDALHEVQFRLRARDGTYRWFASRSRSISETKSRETKWVGIATDVDDLKQAEARLRQLSMQLMKAQDAERRRIAREIHDTTVQNLVAAALEIDQIRDGNVPAGAMADRALGEARHLIGQSLEELRTLSYFFHPPMLDELGLASAIRWYARGLEKRAGLRVSVEGPERMPRLTEEVESTLFRVAQEALANVHRHSGSKEARIRIAATSDGIALEVSDDGKGIPASYLDGASDAGAPLGVGISGMRLRLQQIGGCLKIESSGNGTTVRATVPAGAEGRLDAQVGARPAA